MRGEKAARKRHLRNGLLKAVGKFSGQDDWEWTWFRENGEVMQIGAFDDDKKIGTWRRYHPNGALYDEGRYIDDRKVGEWSTFDAKGKLVKTARHKAQ
jgi:antitoxin component YwqK of YwqJK toxin-antitoxin module